MTIWPQVITTGLLAGGAAALSVPVTRKLMLGSLKQDWLQDELGLDSIEPDGLTIRLKDGTFARVWRFRGTSYDAKVEQEQRTLLMGRSSLLHELGKKGASLRLFAVKRKRPIEYEARWPARALREIGEAEAALFKSSYYVDWYLMASSAAMQPLIEADEIIAARAGDYAPEAVAKGREGEHCPLTGFLNGLISGDYRRDLPALSSQLSGSLPGSDLHFEKGRGRITAHVPEPQHHQIIGITVWPEALSGSLVANILALPGDIEVAQICEPWDADKALLIYKRKQQALSGSFFGNPAAAGETEVILSLLSEGNTTLFASEFQIIARASTEEALTRLVKRICEELGHARVLYRLQTKGAPVCWFNRLPSVPKGKLMPGARLMLPLDLRDENIAALWALPHSAQGLTKSQFGPAPVRYFRTPTGQAYAFQFHVENKPQARGNYLVFAPTGGGKSTLMMHLLGGL
ncbi:VirB4 family type IV secretion system protein, partial [Tepidicaulis sp. LMO-SS28]